MKNKIIVTLKLFPGTGCAAGLEHQDPRKGIVISVDEGARLRTVIGILGIKVSNDIVFFRDTVRITVWTRLRDGDVISVLRTSGGG